MWPAGDGPRFSILQGHEVVPVADCLEWAQWFETAADRQVAYDEVYGLRISTVFVGTYPLPPTKKVFETMVFPPDSSRELAVDRYETWDEAEAGHAAMLQRVLDGKV